MSDRIDTELALGALRMAAATRALNQTGSITPIAIVGTAATTTSPR
jgi:hypothetical protein